MREWRNLRSRCGMTSVIWLCVTAADFDLQQSPFAGATTLLMPAPLPIGGGRHKILTRSMRFLHTPPTGNHSGGQEEGKIRRKTREAEMWRGGTGVSSKPAFLLQGSCGKKCRSCSDMKDTSVGDFHSDVDVNAGIPLSYLCHSEKQQQKTRC